MPQEALPATRGDTDIPQEALLATSIPGGPDVVGGGVVGAAHTVIAVAVAAFSAGGAGIGYVL